MEKIGLTGGIASGKSTVANMFKERGAYIIDADAIAHAVIEPDKPGYGPLIKTFGSEILAETGEIDRKKLRLIVFNSREMLLKINSIIHPLVRAEMKRMYRTISQKDSRALIIHDIPLLIETGLHKKVDWIILVYIEKKNQIQRIMQRDGLTVPEAERLLTIQMTLEEKKQYATYIIDNSGTLDETEKQVAELYRSLQ